MKKVQKPRALHFKFPKSPTGILGLDEITLGGLPKNRTTLLTGGTGCGKTLMAMEFLVKGVNEFGEPGVFVTFEEKKDELLLNSRSLGFNLDTLLKKNKIYMEHVEVDQNEIVESGGYNLEGLFVMLKQAISKVNAKRVVLDSLDTLFSSLDYRILRSEFVRLFSWLKEKKVTAVITAEKGDTFLTRHGLEEYVADCVIVLDNRAANQITTRRLRIVKYRGSSHGNNEYPFEITNTGIMVFPLVSEMQQQKINSERILTSIKELDIMFDKKGFFVGSSILVSGSAGTGKTSIVASFVKGACQNKKKCLFCVFEEAPKQIIRDMKSIGINLETFIKSGHLDFFYSRPTLQNLELHFLSIKRKIAETKPSIVILDPVTNLMTEGPNSDVRLMLTRFVDSLKAERITVMFTAAITLGSIEKNPSDEGISSMVDAWIMVQDIELESQRTRSLYVIKSRGMNHSKEVREFIISDKGITLSPFIKIAKATGGNSNGKAATGENAFSKNQIRLEKKRHNGSVEKIIAN